MTDELKKGSIDIDFPGKQEGEEVKMLIRKHTFILIRSNLVYLLYFLIPVLIYFLGKIFFSFILSFPIYPIFILFISLFYTFFLLFLLIEWIDFYFDAWIVTDRRLIDIEQIGLFRRKVSEMRLEKIQDVSFDLKGVFAAMFHYGSISIQTAGKTHKFEISAVKEPSEIKTEILKLYDNRIKELSLGQIAPQEAAPGVPAGASQVQAAQQVQQPTAPAQPVQQAAPQPTPQAPTQTVQPQPASQTPTTPPAVAQKETPQQPQDITQPPEDPSQTQ